MFGLFRVAKIKATCMGDTLYPMKHYADIDLHDLTNKENFDLSEEAYSVLSNAVGVQKRYHSIEMIAATWLALIQIASTQSQHSFASDGKVALLQRGLRQYLKHEVDITVKEGMPRGLYGKLEEYFYRL